MMDRDQALELFAFDVRLEAVQRRLGIADPPVCAPDDGYVKVRERVDRRLARVQERLEASG